ncbi:addiction module antidote protein [Bdellovibrionota bacterium FG-2]
MKSKQKPSRPYVDSLDTRLSDPKYAIEYLNSILEENNSDLLLLGLRDVARAYGFTYLAESTGLNRESLYKALSKGKNPRIGTILELFTAMGCRIRLEPTKKDTAKRRVI